MQQEAIECALLRHGPDAWPGDATTVRESTAPYGEQPASGGYLRRRAEDYDRGLCLISKDVLDFLGRGAGCDIEVLGRLAEQQVTDAAANDEAFVTCLLQFTNGFTRMRAKLLEPDSVLGLGNGDEFFDDVLRCATG